MMRRLLAVLALVESATGHAQMVTPRPRNSIDWDNPELARKNPLSWSWCQNLTGASCNNGQTAFWYSQGCFIGCPMCDHQSGRVQIDLCKKGFVGKLPDDAISVNRQFATGAARNGARDIYRHNPWRAPGHAPVADA